MANESNIQLIAFDLGGVLVDVDKNVDPHFFCSMDFDLFTRGVLHPIDYFNRISKLSGRNIQELENEFKRMLRIKKCCNELLNSLNQAFTFWSNINLCHFEHLLECSLPFRNYDPCSSGLSFQRNLAKPNQEFFRACILASKLKPSSILFLDDKKQNVIAARQLGIDSHQVTTLAKTVNILSQRSLISISNGESLLA